MDSNYEIGAAGEALTPIAAVLPQTDFGGLTLADTLVRCATEPHCDAPVKHCSPHQECASQTPSTAPKAVFDSIGQCANGSTPTGLGIDDTPGIGASRRGCRRKVAARPPAEPAAVVAEIVMHYRRYEDLRRAYQRIELQAIATCRAICGGDKTAGMKLYKAADNADAELWLTPYRMAVAPLTDAIKAQEKMLAALARELPVYEWAQAVAGLSDRFLAMIVGAAGRPITDYRNPSCLWKRMGMAVIDGERQRRVTGDAALVHGYNAGRRALMWNIEESILKQQLRKDEEAARIANGYYGQVYIDRRAHEVANKGEKYSHHRAKRYVGKRLLRELWRAWRDGKGGAA